MTYGIPVLFTFRQFIRLQTQSVGSVTMILLFYRIDKAVYDENPYDMDRIMRKGPLLSCSIPCSTYPGSGMY